MEILVLLALAIIVAYFVLRFVFKKQQDKKRWRIAETPAVIESIKKIAELATACFFEEKILIEKKAKTLVDNKVGDFIAGMANKEALIEDELCLIARGRVRAGYDLRKMQEDDVRFDNNTVIITLPAVKILDIIINPQDFDYYVENGHWSEEQSNRIKAKAKELIKADALENGILERAADNGVNKIKALMLNFGYKNVVINNK